MDLSFHRASLHANAANIDGSAAKKGAVVGESCVTLPQIRADIIKVAQQC